ncbi:MAG: ZIP family metal transporter [Treponemataceae bacterium]|nr:ZIP family metal transporter [Treponemataceae bacterium]
MLQIIANGLLIPFVGTALGAACVLFMKKELSGTVQKALTGFAAGVMIAASVWSLLIPALDQAAESGMGKISFLPAVIGFCLGMLFLLLLDTVTPHMHANETIEGPKSSFSKTTMMVFAIALHNIPEGMAVGVLYASLVNGAASITKEAALALSIGIAIQNFPEGAIVSMPLRSKGHTKAKSFLIGALTGIVEPIAGLLTIILSTFIIPVMPYLLSFAAGAMIYVVIEELVPEMADESEGHTNIGTILFMLGFSIMMVLDVALG